MIKDYLCKCGESNPNNFYKKYKGVCKSCTEKRKRKWEQDNKERIKQKRDEWKIKNKDYSKEYYKIWYNNNKEKCSINRKIYKTNILKYNSKYKICQNIRKRHHNIIKGKTKTTKYLGCTYKEFINHIESLFEPWMNWNNYGYGKGKWVIDHIKPISKYFIDDKGEFDYNNEYNLLLLHYTNLRPYCFIKNIIKRDNLII